MFYKMIQRKRDMWYSSSECTIDELISYIVNKGEMRDVQIDAIKTYLYLKIACENKPLWELFSRGYFNNLNVWIYVNIVDTKTQIFMQFFLKHLQAVEESYNR
ncbi:hypothetical protein, partial [Defluviitalea raffinosedens]|uniref:hypothetical protein n=1 Tax=Defluviitalea raffinosedens TaxID=1450156 RepID=UPI001E040020